MPLGVIFWVIFVITIIFGGFVYWPGSPGNKLQGGWGFVVMLLIGMLGWRLFGPVVQ